MIKNEFFSELVHRANVSHHALRSLSFAAVVIGLLALALAPGQSAQAMPLMVTTTFTVNSTLDEPNVNPASGTTCVSTPSGVCTLRAAVQAANNFNVNTTGSVVINVPAGSYVLSASLGELQIGTHGNSNVTINGTGNATNTIVQATNSGCPSTTTCNNRVFDLDPNLLGNVTVSIANVTITGGRNSDSFGGAGIISGYQAGFGPDSTTLSNCVVSNNQVLGSATNAPGGGIQNIGGNLTISNCTFSNNTSGSSAGGAVYYDTHSPSVGSLSVTNSTFTNNSLTNTSGLFVGGGGLYVQGASGSTYNVSGSTFTGNTATGSSTGPVGGGAIYLSTGTLTVASSTFTNNQANGPAASTAGGGAIQAGVGTANVSYSRFVGNAASNGPSGILNNNSGPATTTATNNWWGCNGGPGQAGCNGVGGSVSFNPWIVLSHTANPNPILVNQSTTLTASFLQNSAGTPLAVGNLSQLIGLPITFGAAVLGTLSSPQATIQSNGTATAIFTAGGASGAGHANATVDNGTATANITINDTPITGLMARNSSPARPNSTIYLTATITGGSNVSYAWDFGDGALGSGATTPHTFSTAGFYTAHVTATNNVSTVVAITPVTITLNIYLPLVMTNAVAASSLAGGSISAAGVSAQPVLAKSFCGLKSSLAVGSGRGNFFTVVASRVHETQMDFDFARLVGYCERGGL